MAFSKNAVEAAVVPGIAIYLPRFRKCQELPSHFWLVVGAFLILIVALLVNLDCYQLGTCYSKSLPHVDNFVGREEDIRNITRYLDFDHSTIQVVDIAGPPGFGKSTLAKRIGHIFIWKTVKVHYVDIREANDMDDIAEMVSLSVTESSNMNLKHLKRWAHKQYSKTLLIIDNCDKILNTHRFDFMQFINGLIASPRKSIKYILTSQKWVADVGNYQIHAIYNLSSEAATQLLSKVAPGLTEDQKRQIAELTGNVPLALDVVGAIFKFPNAPTAEEVIEGLKRNPVATLSPNGVHFKVNTSIDLAYSYLPPELKELCVNLSHFPASFDQDSAIFIFDLNSYDKVSPLDLLVQRSLLQFNSPTKRYHFHQLIRSYFLHIQRKNKELAKSYFDSKFRLHFTNFLYHILDEEESAALAMLDVEKQNLHYMFSLFTTAKHATQTFYAVNVTLSAIDRVLKQRFHSKELCDISQRMIKAMESYTTDEAASQESFHEMYAKVVIKAAKLEKQLHREVDSAINILSSRKKKIDDGFERQNISTDTYVQFYSDLAKYYREKGEDNKSVWCHAHILKKVHNQKCTHTCKYFDISLAYERIGDRVQAFQFRELAYEHQLPFLSRMQQARLFLALYNDYSNASVGHNASRAANFSSMIIETVYDYLIVASEPEYLEEVYFDAVDFFRAKNMEDHMIYLQHKMQAIVKEQCSSLTEKCGNHYHRSAVDAWNRNCYHLAIHSGKRSLEVIVDPKIRIEIYSIVGMSYYYIGKYSDSQKWLKRALKEDDYPTLIEEGCQVQLCVYLIAGGDYFNIFCYRYVFMSVISAKFGTYTCRI